MTSDFGTSTVLGYPRIGPNRELKRALERYWAGSSDEAELTRVGADLRAATWRRLAGLGLDALPSNTFSLYDQMLDTAVLVDAVPDRYRHLSTVDAYFAMARGTDDLPPLPMTKWWNTNYHSIVPEIAPATAFRLVPDKPLGEVREAAALGYRTRPVFVGPVTFLLFAGASLTRLDELVDVYGALLSLLAAEGVDWVQFDEPALVADRSPDELAAVRRAYGHLAGLSNRPRIFVASYFGALGEALPALADTAVDAIGLDLVHGALPADLRPLRGRTVVAGVVSGRDVWRTDAGHALRLLDAVRAATGERVVVGTSCSLQHVPYTVSVETDLDPALRGRLAFAEEKVAEVVALAAGRGGAAVEAGRAPRAAARPRPARADFAVRAAAQAAHLGLPVLPVTTIGSFPQTDSLRAARAAVLAGTLDEPGYEAQVRAEIERAIRLQERLGIDVLVHGEPERNDMVQYFAEHLDGFAVTRHGWVQSYGSRCTRPPIIHGDVSRPAPITVGWSTYAQSLTDRPVKGMLTGPVTIVAWSFVRADLPLADVVWQVADAIRAEVGDLEAAGISIIQVDEPALRELLPLRRRDQAGYLEWAVDAYRWATSGVADRTQIHTHLCYSDAALIADAIDGLDADVTSIESARSGAPVLAFSRGLGPGVYDIHSPRVPTSDEVAEHLEAALRVIPADRLWVNPDCGLKTRTYPQVEAALTNVVAAARRLRRGNGRLVE